MYVKISGTLGCCSRHAKVDIPRCYIHTQSERHDQEDVERDKNEAI